MIQRQEYLNKLIAGKDKQVIKVITGVRRCGKSTMFRLYINHLQESGVAADQIILINLEDVANESLKEYRALHQYVLDRLCTDRPTYVFIDEIQNCTDFEKAIDSLFLQPKVDLYITGSNAYMLSGELATLLSGRYITVDMLPLSFREFYSGSRIGKERSVQDAFDAFLRYGSFPYMALLDQDESIQEPYLEGIYNTILLKDVAQREGITDVTLLESIIKYLASSIGSPVSAKKACDTINAGGRKLSVNTVERYFRALTDSYIFYKADRYDIRGRHYLKTLSKYYLVDTGLRNLLVAGSSSDLGHLIENVVYLELLRRGYKVYVGKLYDKEIDFVARDRDALVYCQVSASVLDESTRKREMEPLLRIRDHHPKLLLTLDRIGTGITAEGIRHENLLDWLLAD